jgi:uncharacterized repeat protein (TIGR01451 family)/LPXTG-motif cell wall-anchored protein
MTIPLCRRATGGALVVVLAMCLAAVTGAGFASAAAPRVGIAIDDGHTTVTTGNRLTYTITVQNLGSADVYGLTVTQSLPPGVELESADSSGVARDGYVRWKVSLEATAKAVVHATMTVYDTPPDQPRLASMACVSAADNQRPIVCATHSDQLSAGVAAVTAQTRTGPPASGSRAGWWYLLGGLVMLSIGGLAVFLRRRRGTRQPTDFV